MRTCSRVSSVATVILRVQIINGRVAENQQARLDQPTCSVTLTAAEDRGDGGKIDISGSQFRSKPPISCKSIAFVDVKTA